MTSLHKPVTATEYYVRRKINKKIARATGGKVNRRRLMHKYHCEWDALPRERKMRLIEEAITVEEEYQRRVKSGEQLDMNSRHVVLSKSEQSLKDEADGRMKKPPMNGYSLFCKKYFRKHDASGPGGLKDASVAWQQVSAARKQRYQEKALKKRAAYRKYLQSLPAEDRDYDKKLSQKRAEKFEGEPNRPPRNAYVLFVRETMQKWRKSDFSSNTQHMRECAQSWSKLSLEEKQRYKNLLDRELQQYQADVEEFKKGLSEEELAKYNTLNNPHTKNKKIKSVVSPSATARRVSKSEQSLKDEADGRMKKPPMNGYSLFCKKYFRKHGASGPGGLKDASVAWQQVSAARKQRYQEKAQRKRAAYRKYLQSLPAEDRDYDKKLSQKRAEKFEGEPNRPPRSAYIVFVRETMQKWRNSDFSSNTQHMRECAQSWSKLSLEEKQRYKDLLDRELQQYQADVEEFKKGLSEEQLARYNALNKPPVKRKKIKSVVSSPSATAASVNGIQSSANETKENILVKQQSSKKRKSDVEHDEEASSDHGMIPDGSPSRHKKKKHKR